MWALAELFVEKAHPLSRLTNVGAEGVSIAFAGKSAQTYTWFQVINELSNCDLKIGA